jgi:hypothetical protein
MGWPSAASQVVHHSPSYVGPARSRRRAECSKPGSPSLTKEEFVLFNHSNKGRCTASAMVPSLAGFEPVRWRVAPPPAKDRSVRRRGAPPPAMDRSVRRRGASPPAKDRSVRRRGAPPPAKDLYYRVQNSVLCLYATSAYVAPAELLGKAERRMPGSPSLQPGHKVHHASWSAWAKHGPRVRDECGKPVCLSYVAPAGQRGQAERSKPGSPS